MLFSDPDMQEIFEGFLVETRELLDNLTQDLMQIEKEPENLELLNQIFRGFHTIKGTSAFMSFDSIVGITHHAEDILNKLRRSELKVTLPIIDVLLEVHDWITSLVERLTSGNSEPVDYSDTIKRIEVLKNQSDSPSENSTAPEQQDLTHQSALESVVANPELISSSGDFTSDEQDLIDAAFNEVNQSFLEENTPKNNETNSPPIAPVVTELQKSVNEDNSSDNQPKPTETNGKSQPKQPASGGKQAAADTIRVDVTRVETLMDLSGELVLGRNRLAQISSQLQREQSNNSVRDLVECTSQIDFITSEIQSAVMKMRMIPIGKLYQKAPRIVRDLSKEFNKNIVLELKGEETEIDRGIIEELNDPLVHMIRNSCDHGIETPEERIKNGKPPQGTITLDAEQEGNAIVIRISDDGKGMDPEKLKAKAIEKGVITEEHAQQMTRRDAFHLIFMPGFSTAAVISNVSGRGVGMDVVRTNIQNLKGIIDVDSEVGKGSTFTIKLPLTLAIIQGLLVKLANETYAIPLSSVVEVVSIDKSMVYSVKQQEVIRIRQDVLPLVRMDKILNAPVITDTLDNKYVVNVGIGMHRIGLVVDELLGQQEIVIKSLGEYLGHIKGIAGSTILGDGRVIMIIDVAELIEME